MTDAAVPQAGSFRDPAGIVFERNGTLLRQVNRGYEPHYRRLMDSGLYAELIASQTLVPHREVDTPPLDPEPAALVLEPCRVPFVSYPYEWCFGQIQDAALLTLAVQRRAVAHDLTLKDASAFNVQWLDGRPVLIDTLSFETLRPDRPWVAYRQFCQHFLAPLALMSTVDVRLGQLARTHLDGVPLDLAARLLPWRTRLRLGLLVHLHGHAWAQASSARKQEASQASDSLPTHRRFSKTALLGLIDHLERTVKALRWEPGGTTWDGYYQKSNYTAAAFEAKKRIVAEWLDFAQPTDVWDLGANNGTFATMAAERGARTVAFDLDPSCVERAYRAVRDQRRANLLPLWLDLTNPSPALGWQHAERASWLDRGPADLVLALAIVHHLALGGNVPPSRLAECLARACRRWLIVEFIPKSDAQSARLITHRPDVFSGYDEGRFLAAMAAYFEPVRTERLPESERTLHLMRRISS